MCRRAFGDPPRLRLLLLMLLLWALLLALLLMRSVQAGSGHVRVVKIGGAGEVH